ncbi:MAG: glycosyl hydrolase family 18 protein [Chloroflexia bacterium]
MSLRYRRGGTVLVLLAVVLGGLPASESVRAATGSPPKSVPAWQSRMDVRWGFYVTYNPNSWTSLQANAGYLNYVSPWFYYLDAAGQVTGKDQPQVGALLRQVGARSLPMLKNDATYNNFTPIITDTVKQDAIVSQIDAIIGANGYDGITIDFEGLNGVDKDSLTAFMGKLYAKLHPKKKLVAMAVPAKVRESTDGWSAAYDYAALSGVLDYLLIMAYDFHWTTSDPGPVAPMDRLRVVADYAAAKVPRGKIVWGAGVYGYDWGYNQDASGSDGKPAEYRNFAEASAAAATQGAQSGYDAGAQSPWVRYMRNGQQREIWYENRRSFDAKLGLINDYGLAGFGIWRLGQEDPGVWQSIDKTRQPAACDQIDRVSTTSTRVYFPETGHSLKGTFLEYWRAHGGLPVYGYPITEEFTEASLTNGRQYKVQYFERNRFEYHPENRAPNNVLLGLLGVQVTEGRAFPPAGDLLIGPDVVYFPQVAHTLGGPFLRYWQGNGGLAQFGFPISEPVLELSDTDGETYAVQYMQRARFEFHPEYQGTPAEVLLGLLGRNVVPCK